MFVFLIVFVELQQHKVWGEFFFLLSIVSMCQDSFGETVFQQLCTPPPPPPGKKNELISFCAMFKALVERSILFHLTHAVRLDGQRYGRRRRTGGLVCLQ